MIGAAVVSVIDDVGLPRLAHFDGCVCSSFSVKNITVEIHCRKSGASSHNHTLVRVHSGSMDVDGDDLECVARRVAADLSQYDSVSVRFCSYGHDDKKRCSYCGKGRKEGEYLCEKCKGTPEAAEHDYRSRDFTIERQPKNDGGGW